MEVAPNCLTGHEGHDARLVICLTWWLTGKGLKSLGSTRVAWHFAKLTWTSCGVDAPHEDFLSFGFVALVRISRVP